MKTSVRPREVGGSFSSRTRQLSITDPNHHVTEAIGDLYNNDDFVKGGSRPLSFVASPLSETTALEDPYVENQKRSPNGVDYSRSFTNTNGISGGKSNTLSPSQRSNSLEHGSLSPTLSLRQGSIGSIDVANQPFPLNDIDYQSTPAAVAQELSNLQALRRMSMDIGNTSDPDLPSFTGLSLMPSIAPPTGGDNEDDPSRMFWVPARVHPELAPMEFKTFLENRVQSVKRRSGELSSLSPDGPETPGSGSGLRRKKSMLSRQIDNQGGRGAIGYQDGADQLERKKSLSQTPEIKIADLAELDALIRDPTNAAQRLTLETNLRFDASGELLASEDMPILPAAPGIGLRRSTRTAYRRGSLRKGERLPFSEHAKRAGGRSQDADGDESPASPVNPGPLIRRTTDPITENFSRPRSMRRGPTFQQNSTRSADSSEAAEEGPSEIDATSIAAPAVSQSLKEPSANRFPVRKTSFIEPDIEIPQIIETPPPQEPEPLTPAFKFPPRSSSQTSQKVPEEIIRNEPPPRSSRRPTIGRQISSTAQPIPKAPEAAIQGQQVQQQSQQQLQGQSQPQVQTQSQTQPHSQAPSQAPPKTPPQTPPQVATQAQSPTQSQALSQTQSQAPSQAQSQALSLASSEAKSQAHSQTQNQAQSQASSEEKAQSHSQTESQLQSSGQSQSQALNGITQQPSPPPVGSSARPDSTALIPNGMVDKVPERRVKKDKEEVESGLKKSTWGWFKGSDEKEKRKKEEDAKKAKTRVASEKVHDNARLDVLDNAAVRGRESLLLDRDSMDNKLQEDNKKKEGTRKFGEPKKEKDGIFATLFGAKKKGDRDGGKKAGSLRALSPDPPHRLLRPDVDYNWTRFAINDERAIYRLAHLKLAEPRRALYSQVLLSNFMYSYLAKVQQMHPHVQIPASAQQKKQLEMERRQKEAEQRLLEQQRQLELLEAEQSTYDYHQQLQMVEGVTYVDDFQIYDYDHQDADHSAQTSNRPPSRAAQHTEDDVYAGQGQYGQGHEYYPYGSQESEHHQHRGREEMW